MKRILDCCASDFRTLDRDSLKQAILAAEGRTLVAETIVTAPPLYPDVTNGEIVKAFGADLLLLNMLDVFAPAVSGLDPAGVVRDGRGVTGLIPVLKHLTGLPVGVNLEPVAAQSDALEQLEAIAEGRTATPRALAQAKALGCDFVCLTGNPKTGVTNAQIEHAIGDARTHFGGLVIAGKMHSSGTRDGAPGDAAVRFAQAGADVVLLPAPGTVPGVREGDLARTVQRVKQEGALVLAAIGTSQEGADEATVREIGLSAKRAGADMLHIGDCGFTGIAVPENIMALSIAIRGRRHTYIRMARSAVR
ncbi:DUF7916 family protein [Chitiniphilus eburneus]|uniref:Haloacid dehalogenase-like hydrolase n=1 Tax=Chitiniphilus eburneus TaxID=2571148 RepID=A0A4U0PZQ9_9NEIS|nr:haloacid dehalogenase-like hydrolase [Chitiniphilus eburneus]TJZ74079.1 haloacid dehalogenase-like hydrolase [Chitiniphilus eburneus]